MARVTEGTVHSEEVSKQYLESVKTVKQVDATHQWTSSKNNGKHKGEGHGGQHSQSHHWSQSRKPGSCNNCGSNHPTQEVQGIWKRMLSLS